VDQFMRARQHHPARPAGAVQKTHQ
jgi:hypothetical protein